MRCLELASLLSILLTTTATACSGDPGGAEGEVGTEGGLDGSTSPSSEGGSEAGSDDTGTGGTDGEPPEPGAYAADISVERVEVNQGVGIDVIAGGAPLDPGAFVAPLIGGRPALVRVAWALGDGFSPRDIKARVTLEHSGGTYSSFEATRFVDGDADLAHYDGAFTLAIPAEQMQAGDGISVELLEAADAAQGASASNRVPHEGSAPLDVWGERMKVKVVVLPANDPSIDTASYTPDDAIKAMMEADLRNLYPVNEVEIIWHEAIELANCIHGSGVLGQLGSIRAAEGLGPEVYYHAIFPDSHQFKCEAGGKAILAGPETGADRVGFSVNFAGQAPNNFTHELGHSHGRNHSFEDSQFEPTSSDQAACGRREDYGFALYPNEHPAYAAGFTYPALANLQAWIIPPTVGLPLVGNVCEGHANYDAMGPALNDVMSYAYPYWVNAYTYRHLAERVRVVSALGEQSGSIPGSTSLHLVEAADGEIISYQLPAGDRSMRTSVGSLTFLDESGKIHELPAWPKVTGDGDIAGWVVDQPEGVQLVALSSDGRVRELALR